MNYCSFVSHFLIVVLEKKRDRENSEVVRLTLRIRLYTACSCGSRAARIVPEAHGVFCRIPAWLPRCRRFGQLMFVVKLYTS